MKVLRYQLHLDAPAVLTRPAGDPNSAETLSFVSGASIRGALAARWLAVRGKRRPKDPDNDPAFRALFLDGGVRYLHAYPMLADGARQLPSPLSLRVRKGATAPVWDLAHPAAAEELLDPDAPEVLKPWDQPFCRLRDGTLAFRPVHRTARLHNQRDRELGRAAENRGALFSYVSIDPGQRFQGLVLMDDETQVEPVRDLLTRGSLRLGRSRAAQYGGAAVVAGVEELAGDGFRESDLPPRVGPGDRLVVTLLSDYLGVDAQGHPTPDALEAELYAALGFGPDPVEPEGRFRAVGVVGGYVGVWRMPRADVPAVRGGSVLVLPVPDPPGDLDERLKTVSWSGLGLRREEGFGRLAFGWHGTPKDEDDTEELSFSPAEDVASVQPAVPAPDPVAAKVLALMQHRLLLGALLDDAPVQARHLLGSRTIRVRPSRSLVGRLRGRLRTALAPQEVLAFLDNCEHKPAGKSLRSCRLGSERLDEWLRDALGTPARAYSAQTVFDNATLTTESSVTQGLNDAKILWPVQRLYIETVLKGLAREARAPATPPCHWGTP